MSSVHDRPAVSIDLRRDPITLPDGRPAESLGWVVLVGGRQHGGRNYSYTDALAHKAACQDWTQEQYDEWTGRVLPDLTGV